ncbi:hypothetical protein HF086_008190 [Spodoptera exigua]|uniref:RING-Gid-type domain-containing protein n=1 Tax=Spodoptera exigua TaxID=7107 RepID=A0A922SA90_SPOEX|nr:hypothetical protein HF086_008190 [Spodoptera exigua]
MNELKSLEHATLKVPYEVFNKRYRNAQRVFDVEARQVGSIATEVDTATKKQGVTSGEIDTLLGGMVEKLTTMKRKASEAIAEEMQAAYVCKKRMLVEYFLRNGYYDSANKLADARGLRELTNVVREDKRLEAVKYAKKHFSTFEEDQLKDIQHCMGMLAFPKDTEVEPYRSLLQQSRWAALVQQFRWEHSRLLHPARLAALPAALQLGLAALNTPQCYSDATRVSACPACQPPLNALAATLPHAHVSHSRLLCRISRAPLNEHNHPMVLPNGQVYGEKALKEMMKEHGSIICPKTKEVFCMKRVEKVYVM